MKRYKQLIKELPSKKVVFAFGRFQPPTNGHALLVNAVTKLASAQKADHVIYTSRTQDKKSNPLPANRKVYYLKRMFPHAKFMAATDNMRTFMEVAAELSKKYKHLVMIAGSDRVAEYKKLLDKYNGTTFNFETIEVVSAGERDPDSDTASGMSGTKMREAAKKGNFAAFKKGLPHGITELDAKRLMNEIREGMGIDAIKESIQFERDTIRESYHSGNIFNVGDKVLFEEQVCEIVKRGSNHVLIQLQDGSLESKWLNQVQVFEDVAQEVTEEINEMKYTASDKIKVARVIAMSLGLEEPTSNNPELLVNTALRRIKNKTFSARGKEIVANMLDVAKEAGIKYDEKLAVAFKQSEVDEEVVGKSLHCGDNSVRVLKIKHHLGEEADDDEEEEEMSDDDLDKVADSMNDDHMLHGYDDEELDIIDDETGEKVDELKEETLNEVLSRQERIKSKIRFARTKSKRERRLRIALKTRSSVKKVNTRARRLAVKALKMRIAKRPLNKLSVGEKERLEKIVQRRKSVINRLAMRMVPKVRKYENDRLVHSTYTK